MNVRPQIKLDKLGDGLRYNIPIGICYPVAACRFCAYLFYSVFLLISFAWKELSLLDFLFGSNNLSVS